MQRLRSSIWLGELAEGERLPSERALAEGFEVSRLTIREALRILQGEGLIAIRRGATGGSIVASKNLTAEQRHRRVLEMMGDLRDAHQMRRAVEPWAAAFAAAHATSEQLELMQSCQDELLAAVDIASFRRADSAFHLAIANASGNTRFASAIREARSALFVVLDAQEFDVLKPSSACAHAAIVEAIVQRDEQRASDLMSQHLEEAWSEILAVLEKPA